jgi:hypothetical protein
MVVDVPKRKPMGASAEPKPEAHDPGRRHDGETPKKSAEPKPEAHDSAKLSGTLRRLGVSMSHTFNNVLVNQAMSALWLKNSDAEEIRQHRLAAVAALAGIKPGDELEGMIAAQLVACHNASMECYRRAMIGEQTFEGRQENLNQANRLSRTYSTLLEALNRHRGKGTQKVTVEHVHVHEGAQSFRGRLAQISGK